MQVNAESSQHRPVSAVLQLSREYPLHEKPEMLYVEGEALSGEGVMFNPLPGFHFGACGPMGIHSPVMKTFYSDVPVLMAYLVLDGSFRYRTAHEDDYADIHRNMFLMGSCDGHEVDFFYPAQQDYCYVGIIVQESRIGEVFGAATGAAINRLLLEAACPEAPTVAHRTGARLLSGIANPEVVTIAQGLREMQVAGGTLELMCHRSAALDFFVKLFAHAAGQDNAPPVALHEQDRHRLAALKKHIEESFLSIGSAAEVCTDIGMSFSKANKAFRALYSTTIAQYIQHCKMSHAHAMLVARKLNVSECAFEIGYSNVSHFISAFKKQYRLTPKAVSRLAAEVRLSA